MYRQFNIQQFYVLPTQCIYVFCVDLRTNSDYFPIQHYLTGSYNPDGEFLLRGTDRLSNCNSAHTALHAHATVTKHQTAKTGNFEKAILFLKMGSSG